jgi:hypothetical protein
LLSADILALRLQQVFADPLLWNILVSFGHRITEAAEGSAIIMLALADEADLLRSVRSESWCLAHPAKNPQSEFTSRVAGLGEAITGWCENLGHADVLTTFTSYEAVALAARRKS